MRIRSFTMKTFALILSAATLFAGAAATPSAAAAQGGPRLDQAFDQMDANHDGVVSRAEFIASRHARFLGLDRNHDGYLTAADIPPLAHLTGRADKISAMLARFDLDHDGKVSEQEFVTGSLAMFDLADTNHDGVLTRAEAAAATQAMRARAAGKAKP